MASPTQKISSSSASSTSVRIRYHKNAIPQTHQEVSEALSAFGEIVRLDDSLVALNGTVQVTYFDVRSAQAALVAYAPNAETFPEASHDFRRVCMMPSALQDVVSRLGGFHTFGEIARVSRNGNNIELEFFDTRSAHKVILAVPGSKPVLDTCPAQLVQETHVTGVGSVHQQMMLDQLWTLMMAPGDAKSSAQPTVPSAADASIEEYQLKNSGHVLAQVAAPKSALIVGSNIGVQGARKMCDAIQAHQGKLAALKTAQVVAQRFAQIACKRVGSQETQSKDDSACCPRRPSAASFTQRSSEPHVPVPYPKRPAPGLGPPMPFGTPARVHCSGLTGWERPCGAPSVDEPMFIKPTPLPNSATAVTQGSQQSPQEPSRDAREMVNGSKHVMFDIDPQRIVNNEDTRTTVMVRNIPKPCSREDIIELLAKCGLSDKHNFLHIPFDKRGKLRCGVAFVNFLAPDDVLRLVRSQELMGVLLGATEVRPAVSYARLQGISQLRQHFGLAAMVKETKQRMLPTFDLSLADTSDPASSDELSGSQRSSSESSGTRQRMTRVHFEDRGEGRAHA